MKKSIFKVIGLLLAAVIMISCFSSCAIKVKNTGSYSDYSYIDDISYTNRDGKSVKSFSGSDGDWFDISFEKPTVIDTVVLKEKNDTITDFEILIKQNGNFVSIYEQDLVGSFRYCAFADVETDTLRVKINTTKTGSFSIKGMDVLNSKHKDADFRIASYVIADRVYDETTLDAGQLNVITDIILFGAASFDENGQIIYNDFTIDGETVSGEKVISRAIENINNAVPDKKFKYYINILGPSGENDEEKQNLHTQCFKNNSTTLISNINSMLLNFGADGVYFDYEYPYAAKHMKAFSDFLCELDKGLTAQQKIGVALGPWGKVLSKSAKSAVDYIEIMSYDLFDDNGYHSSFASQGGAFSVDYFNSKGYDISKCDLGIPFYGRPVNADAYWFNYNSCYETLGKNGNVDYSTVYADDKSPEYSVARYYNSYQMVFDKTAFAYDYGTGGMMVWHYSCDAPTDSGLSLFDAMAQAILSRQS